MRLCQINGELRITIPRDLKIHRLRNFVAKNMSWLDTNLKSISPRVPIVVGGALPVHGRERTIVIDSHFLGQYSLTKDTLTVPELKLALKNQMRNVMIEMAVTYFNQYCNAYAKKLDVAFSKISIRDPKSRWGSCSSNRRLMFSWRLVMAPSEVSSYVAAHEIAHLIYMDHSQNFWNTVGEICPTYKVQRAWLKKYGQRLHKFAF